MFGQNDLRPTVFGCQATDSIPPQVSRKAITRTINTDSEPPSRIPNSLMPSTKLRSANLHFVRLWYDTVGDRIPVSRTPSPLTTMLRGGGPFVERTQTPIEATVWRMATGKKLTPKQPSIDRFKFTNCRAEALYINFILFPSYTCCFMILVTMVKLTGEYSIVSMCQWMTINIFYNKPKIVVHVIVQGLLFVQNEQFNITLYFVLKWHLTIPISENTVHLQHNISTSLSAGPATWLQCPLGCRSPGHSRPRPPQANQRRNW